MEWRGRYFDGRTALAQPVRVTIGSRGLHIAKTDRSTLWWDYDQVRQTQGAYAGEQVRLERGPPVAEALLVDDAGFLAAIHAIAPEQTAFHNPARRPLRLKLTLLAALCLPLLGGALYLWGIPAVAEALAGRVPVSWEEQLGRSVVGLLAPPEARLEDPVCTEVLEGIGDRLLEAVPTNDYRFRYVLKRDRSINAFAAPGGFVVVHTALVSKTGSSEELAGVLAHEMQHILKRHTTAALFRDLSIQVLIAAWTGDLGGLEVALETAGTLGKLRFSRQAETEADLEGLKMLQAAGIAPGGMVAFFKSLEKMDLPEGLTYLSTHPRGEDRIKQLEQLAAGMEVAPVPLLPEVSWEQVKSRCAPDGTSGEASPGTDPQEIVEPFAKFVVEQVIVPANVMFCLFQYRVRPGEQCGFTTKSTKVTKRIF